MGLVTYTIFQSDDLKVGYHFRDLSVDRMIILKGFYVNGLSELPSLKRIYNIVT